MTVDREKVILLMAKAIDPVPWGLEGEYCEKRRGYALSDARLAFNSIEAQGHVIVPVEPTEEMVEIGVNVALHTSISIEETWPQYITRIYKAMIQSQKGGSDGKER